jgi:hypothetical protein
MSITVEGTLAADARYGTHGIDAAVVTLRISAGPHCLPFEAHLMIGRGPGAAIEAQRTAAGLKRGMPARAVAARLDLTGDHGDVRFSLRDCTVNVNGQPVR